MTTLTPPFQSDSGPSAPNSVQALGVAARGGRLSPLWPLAMAFIRLPLILLGHFVALASFYVAGHSDPWGAAVSMTNF